MDNSTLSIDPEIEETEEQIVSRLRESSIEWVESDDRENELRLQLKVITEKKRELGPLIEADLSKLNKNELTLRRGGKLKFTTSTTTTSVKKEELLSALKTELESESLAETIANKVFDKTARSGKTVTSLKRTKK